MEQMRVSFEVDTCRKDSRTRRRNAVSNPKDWWKSSAGSNPAQRTHDGPERFGVRARVLSSGAK